MCAGEHISKCAGQHSDLTHEEEGRDRYCRQSHDDVYDKEREGGNESERKKVKWTFLIDSPIHLFIRRWKSSSDCFLKEVARKEERKRSAKSARK